MPTLSPYQRRRRVCRLKKRVVFGVLLVTALGTTTELTGLTDWANSNVKGFSFQTQSIVQTVERRIAAASR